MTSTGSTGARWLDIALIGSGCIALPLLVEAALLTHPGVSLDPNLSAIVLWVTFIGASFIAVGLVLGKRTRWKVPDPKAVKVR